MRYDIENKVGVMQESEDVEMDNMIKHDPISDIHAPTGVARYKCRATNDLVCHLMFSSWCLDP